MAPPTTPPSAVDDSLRARTAALLDAIGFTIDDCVVHRSVLESGRAKTQIEGIVGSAWLRASITSIELEARLLDVARFLSVHIETHAEEGARDDLRGAAQLRFVVSAEHVEYVDCRREPPEIVEVAWRAVAIWCATRAAAVEPPPGS